MNDSVHWRKKCKVTQNQILSNKIRTGVLKIHRDSGPMIWDSVGERRYNGRRNVLNLALEEGTIFVWGKQSERFCFLSKRRSSLYGLNFALV